MRERTDKDNGIQVMTISYCKSVTYMAGDLVLRKCMKKKLSGSVPTWSGPYEIRSITKTLNGIKEFHKLPTILHS